MYFTDLSTIDPGGGVIDSWEWDFGDGSQAVTIQNPSYAFSSGGAFITQLIVTTNFGCSDTITDTIRVFPKPNAIFTVTPETGTILNPVETFTDASTGDSVSQWQWDFGDGDISLLQNPVHTYRDTGIYTVLLTIADTNGCMDTAYALLEIQPDYIFFIPNTFSPNKDGLNEVFMPKGIGVNEKFFNMKIFNRWGDLIYQTADLNAGWDGTSNNGKEGSQTDVYVWVINTRDLTGFPHTYTGHVTLIR